MRFHVGNNFCTRLGLNICFSILAVALVAVCGDKTFEDSDLNSVSLADSSEFKKIWELYILPRLEYDLRNRLNELEEIKHENIDDINSFRDLDDSAYSPKGRNKRLSVAGLDNLDLMTKTLDRANRFKLPMSVGGMTTNRLRMLMAAAGRKRK